MANSSSTEDAYVINDKEIDELLRMEEGQDCDEGSELESDTDQEEENYMDKYLQPSFLNSSQEDESFRQWDERGRNIQDKLRKESDDDLTDDEMAPNRANALDKEKKSSCLKEMLMEKKRISFQPPGLDLFQDSFLKGFTAEKLDLERDFGLDKKRAELTAMGVEEDTLKEIFGDPDKFIMYLAPESCSALISSEEDFVKICDYLFFYCSSSLDEFRSSLYAKALFDLVKNYAFKWTLKLSHIYTCLHNFGIKSDLLADESLFKTILCSRIEIAEKVAKSKGKEYKFALPECHEFYLKGVSERIDSTGDLNQSDRRYSVIKSFVGLVSDFICSHPDRTEFRPKTDDWTSQLILLYVFFLVATDRNLISDPLLCRDLMTLTHFQLNSFSHHQWCGESGEEKQKSSSFNNPMNNALSDVSEVLAEVGGQNYLLEHKVAMWQVDDLPLLPHFKTIDHHHNMVRRLQYLPYSYRGNQVKKSVAFICLQHILDPDEISSFGKVGVGEAHDLLMKNLAKFNVLLSETYTMFNIIKLLDTIIGNEASDFEYSNLRFIRKIKEVLSNSVNKLRADVQQTDPARLKEFMSQVSSKWHIIEDRYKD